MKKKIILITTMLIIGISITLFLNATDHHDKTATKLQINSKDNVLKIGDTISLKLPDQDGNVVEISKDTKILIIAFTKKDGHTVREYLNRHKDFLLKQKKAYFIVDISSVPVPIRNLLILPKLQKKEYQTLLIYEKEVSKMLKTKQKGSMVIKLFENTIESISYVSDDRDLDNLFSS